MDLFKEMQNIDPQRLINTGLLKEGNFGYIYTGRFQDDNENESKRKIVIKSFRGNQSLEKREYFYLDLCYLSQIKDDHENVVKIIGYFDKLDLGVIMNYEAFYIRGKIINDLLGYLIHLREQWERKKREFGDWSEKLPSIFQPEELHLFVKGIAKGCNYLHDNKIKIGDLSAKNISIDSNKTVKLTDYGMLNVKKYLVNSGESSSSSFPGSAPKLYQEWKVLAKSDDVWSFGEVIWEIGTLGGIPENLFDDKESELKSQYPYFKFYKEDAFSEKGIKILHACFQLEPEKRPNFHTLVNYLEQLDCVNGTKGECQIYKNLNSLPVTFELPHTREVLEEKLDMLIPNVDRTIFGTGKNIGYGTFGQVSLVDLQQQKSNHWKAAVKDLFHDGFHMNLITEKLDKIKQHKNIVRIFGFSPSKRFIVMEYVSFTVKDGSTEMTGLENYLKHLREKVKAGSAIDIQELGYISVQIARGMSHLDSLAIVHGNLSARNILIDNTKTIKITDYFMPWVKTMTLTYHCRWASPELLSHGCQTIKSDVWAFGIVLWEIASLGGYPFGYLRDAELKKQIPQMAIYPEIPASVTRELEKLMRYCWKRNSMDRPCFNQIFSNLDILTAKKNIYEKYDFIPDLILPPTMEEC